MNDVPHFCFCNKVEKCSIHTHPSEKVQQALNKLMTEMAKWDDETGSKSRLSFISDYENGRFESITTNARLSVEN